MKIVPNILIVAGEQDRYAHEIVTAAFKRSFTFSQIETSSDTLIDSAPAGLVLVNPIDLHYSTLESLCHSGRKTLLLGRLSDDLARFLGLRRMNRMPFAEQYADAGIDETLSWNESPLSVCYNANHVLGGCSPYRRRPFCRYDFADEWNNHGYGRIALDNSSWSLVEPMVPSGGVALAEVQCAGYPSLAYITLAETADSAVLWCNRSVGPVDSLEWRIIETFFGDYRPDALFCFPYLAEIPYGYDAAVTMRLDCDEAISTARPLFEMYQDGCFPFSLALVTGQAMNAKDRRLLVDVLHHGGAVLPHSVHHYPDWGGSPETIGREVVESRDWFHENLPQACPVRYVVSPFHQNSRNAVRTFAACGLDGFISGIIHNDPEFLLGRAGQVPFVHQTLISHSQQCMMHGDCYHRYHDLVDPYFESFLHHQKAGAIFGYLDHPLSERYQYGWNSEEERLGAHKMLLNNIRANDNVWFANLNQVMDFLKLRETIQLGQNPHHQLQVHSSKDLGKLEIGINWRGECHAGRVVPRLRTVA